MKSQGEIFIEAVKRFGGFTMKNYIEAVEWIAAEREKRDLDSAHYTPPAHVRKFEPREDLSGEDGWK